VRADHAASIADIRLLISRSWQATVKRFELRPGSVTEWMTGDIMERLLKMVENKRATVYRQETTVKKVEKRNKTVWAGGHGKDATTKDEPDGWWVTFSDSPTAIRCETKPDCEVGDKAVCTWEFHKHD
jgi:hypothetical protein